MSKDYSIYVEVCKSCEKHVCINKSGKFRVHGPRHRACSGSGTLSDIAKLTEKQGDSE
jgi:hypothetical protein